MASARVDLAARDEAFGRRKCMRRDYCSSRVGTTSRSDESRLNQQVQIAAGQPKSLAIWKRSPTTEEPTEAVGRF